MRTTIKWCYFTNCILCITNLKAFGVRRKLSVLARHWRLRWGVLLLWSTWWNGSYCWSCCNVNTIITTVIGCNNTGMICYRCYCLWHCTIKLFYSSIYAKRIIKNLKRTKINNTVSIQTISYFKTYQYVTFLNYLTTEISSMLS